MAYSDNSVKNNSAAGRVYSADGLALTLRTPTGGGHEPCVIDDTYGYGVRQYEGECPTLRSERSGLKVQAVLTPDREEKRQNGRRMKEDGEPMFTLTAQDKHGVAIEYETDTNKICKT